MVEPTHQDRCTGKGFKLPKGAVFKRHGTERSGKGCAVSMVAKSGQNGHFSYSIILV